MVEPEYPCLAKEKVAFYLAAACPVLFNVLINIIESIADWY